MNTPCDPEDMYREVDWLKPSDYPILQEMAKYDGWHTPKSLSLNLPNTRNWVGQRCREMAERDLVERHPDEPGYRISDKGREFLEGNLQPADLQDDDDSDDS